MKPLVAPFAYFGSKRSVAPVIWHRLGAPRNYIEPFAGSLAVLLARPGVPGDETANDLDGHIANFWRAVRYQPEALCKEADYPVSEVDLVARHRWLVHEPEMSGFAERLKGDPEFVDVKRAAWWLWGKSCWLGSGWCDPPKAAWSNALPGARPSGINAKLPIADGHGVNGNDHIGPDGTPDIWPRISALARRLRRVRLTCGDWRRVLTPAHIHAMGLTGVFLDPPYGGEDMSKVYACDSASVFSEVVEWCLEHGADPKVRIALSGYAGTDGGALESAGWSVHRWKANGGFSNTGKGGDCRGQVNKGRETIWFSPACLPEGDIFGGEEDAS